MSESFHYASNESAPPNKAALWSMILGISGFVLSFVVIGGLLGLAAAIVGIIGVIKPGRKGMSITGITTGALSLPISFVAAIIWLGVFVAFSAGGPVARARTSATLANMSNLSSALQTFEVDNSRYPSTPEGLSALVTAPPGMAATWRGPYVATVPIDAWGTPYNYQGPDLAAPKIFTLISAGPDTTVGTPDDLTQSMPP